MKRLVGSVVALGLLSTAAGASVASREKAPTTTTTSAERAMPPDSTLHTVAERAGKVSVQAQTKKPAPRPGKAKIETPSTTLVAPEETTVEVEEGRVKAASLPAGESLVNAISSESLIPKLGNAGLRVVQFVPEKTGVPFATVTVSAGGDCGNEYNVAHTANQPGKVDVSMGLIGYLDDLKAISENNGNWAEYGDKIGHPEGGYAEVVSVDPLNQASLDSKVADMAADTNAACDTFLQSQTNP